MIVIMALDHVRDYFHVSGWLTNPLDPKTTTTILFLTRWITHFCAPVFVFLSGASAWLQRVKGKETAVLSQHLFTRGLWLVVMEFTVLSFGWSFSIPLFPNLQTIWAIGCSMIGLSALVWLPRRAVLGIGIAIVGLHNFTDSLHGRDLGGGESCGPSSTKAGL